MEIISENGKDYLVSFIAKLDNYTVDASGLFTDIREAIYEILKRYNRIHKTKYSYIDKDRYGGNLQQFLNRFSGDYFSPSFLKNYMTNPALCLFSSFFTEDANDATAIGTTFHAIMEDYYKLPPEERNREKLWDIEKARMLEGQDKSKLDEYINGFITSGDYLGGEMDDTKLECNTERRGRELITVKSLGYTLPCRTAYVIDRLDYRPDGIYIIDYKTGKPRPDAVTFNGYLGSMLIYKWGIEQELDIKVKGAYLLCPGLPDQYMKLDFSIENERAMIEKIEQFYQQFKKDNARRVYEYTDEGYFNTDDARAFRNTMNDSTIYMSKLPVKIYIGETENRES